MSPTANLFLWNPVAGSVLRYIHNWAIISIMHLTKYVQYHRVAVINDMVSLPVLENHP